MNARIIAGKLHSRTQQKFQTKPITLEFAPGYPKCILLALFLHSLQKTTMTESSQESGE